VPDPPRVRDAIFPDDGPAIAAIDTSFTTGTIYDVTRAGDSFELTAKEVDPPVTKTFPIDGITGRRAWERAWVAEDDGRVVGFCAVHGPTWNRRLVVYHLYVDCASRGRGLGHALLEQAVADGRAVGARSVWLETNNLDHPAVQWYRRQGFELCGLDTTLYEPDYAPGEIALFMTRRL
jgi:ribosomal protein S18 acetylase RimI-like enzyme